MSRDARMFAANRIRSLTITNRPCQLPLGFDLEAYSKNTVVVVRGKPIEAELLFDKKIASWVRDRQWHPSQQLSLLKGGRLRMISQVADTPELPGWILSFGSGVRVLEPASLREKVRQEAKKIVTPDVTPP